LRGVYNEIPEVADLWTLRMEAPFKVLGMDEQLAVRALENANHGQSWGSPYMSTNSFP
jgi:hypothetical protein